MGSAAWRGSEPEHRLQAVGDARILLARIHELAGLAVEDADARRGLRVAHLHGHRAEEAHEPVDDGRYPVVADVDATRRPGHHAAVEVEAAAGGGVAAEPRRKDARWRHRCAARAPVAVQVQARRIDELPRLRERHPRLLDAAEADHARVPEGVLALRDRSAVLD